MRWVPPPSLPSRHDLAVGRFKGDLQLAAWRQRRGFSSDLHGDPTTLGMSEDKLAFLLMEVERRRLAARYRETPSADRADSRIDLATLGDHLFDAMCALTPRLSAPELDPSDRLDMLAHILAQPEVQDFLLSWQSPRRVSCTGPAPFDDGAKALLCLLGMTKHTHGTAAYQDLYAMPQLRQLFADALQTAARRHDLPDPEPFTLALYAGTTRRMRRLAHAASFRPNALRAKARMFKALTELYPRARFGERLLIDGHLLPAWCPQQGRGATDTDEQSRRATTPRAGARLVQYTRAGKRDLSDNDLVRAANLGSTNFVRGYYYVCILDQASGWPLVSTTIDASIDEAEAIIPLLSDLFRYYDFIRPRYIAGDGAWDEAWVHRACELFYGISPVFRHTDRAERQWTDVSSASIRGFSHDGRAKCRAHNRNLAFHSFERPNRDGLRPGQGAAGHPDSPEHKHELARREAQFRIRYHDTHDGVGETSRPTLRCDLDWRRLCSVPSYPEGRPDIYALRRALMVRLRNQMEGYFSRVTTAVGLGTNDGDRVRFQDHNTVDALFQLAEIRFAALSLAAERGHLGRPPAPLPGTAPLGPLPVQRRGGGPAVRPQTAVAKHPSGDQLPSQPQDDTLSRPSTSVPHRPPGRGRRRRAEAPSERHDIPSARTAESSTVAGERNGALSTPTRSEAPQTPLGKSRSRAEVQGAEVGQRIRSRPVLAGVPEEPVHTWTRRGTVIRVDFASRRRIGQPTFTGNP